MISICKRHQSGHIYTSRLITFTFAVMMCFTTALSAAPGAHGPNGEHLDSPTSGSTAVSRQPRVETSSDLFEVVATLSSSELSILIDRYATNAPVLGATVEVEFGTLKAKAKFHADHGDYAIDDSTFLQAISKPGAHPLVFTIFAGEDGDLVTGTLTVADTEHQHHHHEFLGLSERTWIVIGVLVLLIIGVVAILWRRQLRPATYIRKA